MPVNENANLVEQAKMELNLIIAAPSTSTPKYVNLKNYERATVFISVLNGSTVTGSAITLLQATDIANANSDEKAVAFSSMYANTDVAAGEELTKTTVVSNTFTTGSTNSKQLVYAIEITPSMLDIANGFDCFRVGAGNSTNTLIFTVHTLLWPSKYGAGGHVNGAQTGLAPAAETN